MYSRELNDAVLTLSASGWTYRNTFVLYDHQTETLWYHLDGTNGLTGISGPHEGAFLPELGSVSVPWSAWFATHPDSEYWLYPSES